METCILVKNLNNNSLPGRPKSNMLPMLLIHVGHYTYCSNSILNITSLVSGGRLVKNNILFGMLEPTM